MPIDYSEYGLEFQIKSTILRGYGKCAACGAKNHQANPNTGSEVVLTVHHLDGDIKNNGILNLAPLCQKCHLGAHRDGLAEVKLSGEYRQWVDVLLQFVCYVVGESSAVRPAEVRPAEVRASCESAARCEEGSQE